MSISVSAETVLGLNGAPVRHNVAVGRGIEIALVAVALLVAPLAFVVGLAIYAVRHYTR